jgi:hypothetical protein
MFVWAYKNHHKISEIIDFVGSRSELVARNADKLSAMQGLKVGLLNYNDIQAHVSTIEKATEELLNSLPSPSDETKILSKTIVNFFHEPRDTFDPIIMDCNAKLLEKGVNLFWVYSRLSGSSFESEMEDSLKRYFDEKNSNILERCAFLRMNEAEIRTPLDFSVAAPFFPDRAITYIGFPGDEMRDVALTIEHPGLLGGQVNFLAIELLSRIPERNCYEKSPWRVIRSAALRRLNGQKSLEVENYKESESATVAPPDSGSGPVPGRREARPQA